MKKPQPSTIWESELEDKLNMIDALGGSKKVLKYLKEYKPNILSIQQIFHDLMNEYLKKIKEYYRLKKD